MNIRLQQGEDGFGPVSRNFVQGMLVQKQAGKLVGNVFQSDKKMDQTLSDMLQKREELLQTTTEKLKELSRLQEERKEMLSQAEDPVVAKNIEDITERMTEIWKEVDANRTKASAYGQAVSNTKVERLKSHAMVDASNQAEDLLIQSAKELASALMEEAQQNIEEEFEETKEMAEKVQEKREEMTPESEQEDSLTEQILSQSEKKDDIDKKIQKMLDELNLLMDDIKGIKVDCSL